MSSWVLKLRTEQLRKIGHYDVYVYAISNLINTLNYHQFTHNHQYNNIQPSYYKISPQLQVLPIYPTNQRPNIQNQYKSTKTTYNQRSSLNTNNGSIKLNGIIKSKLGFEFDTFLGRF